MSKSKNTFTETEALKHWQQNFADRWYALPPTVHGRLNEERLELITKIAKFKRKDKYFNMSQIQRMINGTGSNKLAYSQVFKYVTEARQ